MLAYARDDEGQRRGFRSDNEVFEWRSWVAYVYVASDLDFCPLGVQAVHLSDVDRRLPEFDAVGLGEIVESQFESFVAKVPFFLTVLSGWPHRYMLFLLLVYECYYYVVFHISNSY